MNLSDVSQTAIYTLICRVTQIEKGNPGFDDSMAVLCLNNLIASLSEEDKKSILKLKKLMAGGGSRDAKRIVQRTSIIDGIVNDYISKNPSCTVISLACGLDTRFWRIDNEKCKYLELDLPEVISQKKEILKEHLNYELIGCSVLDTSWIDRITVNGNSNFLIIAEGLFMYLSEPDATRLLQEIARRFNRSQFVLDMIHKKWTKGFYKKFVAWNYKFFLGLNTSWEFGFQDPHDIESYGDGYKVIDVKGKPPYVLTASINENA